MADEALLFHGAHLDAVQVRKVLDHMFRRNLALSEEGGRGVPICIWGVHGIGKTCLVTDYVEQQDPPWKFAYCAPAHLAHIWGP